MESLKDKTGGFEEFKINEMNCHEQSCGQASITRTCGQNREACRIYYGEHFA